MRVSNSQNQVVEVHTELGVLVSISNELLYQLEKLWLDWLLMSQSLQKQPYFLQIVVHTQPQTQGLLKFVNFPWRRLDYLEVVVGQLEVIFEIEKKWE